MTDYQTPSRVFLQYILYVLFKRKGLILWVFLAVTLSMMLASRVVYPKYLATAKVWLHKTSTQSIEFFPDIQRPALAFQPITAAVNWIEYLNGQEMAMRIVEEFELDEFFRDRTLNPKTFRDRFWFTYRQVLALPVDLLTRVGLLPPRAERDFFVYATRAVQQDMKSLNIVGIQSDVSTLSVYGPTPSLAQDIANFLAAALVERVVETEQSAARFAIDFAMDQLEEVTAKLKHAENELTTFQKAAGVLDINQQLLRQVTETTNLESQIKTLEANRERLQTKVQTLNDQIEAQNSAFVSSILLQKNLSERQGALLDLAVTDKALQIALEQLHEERRKARALIEAEFTIKRLKREADILSLVWTQFSDKLVKLRIETVSRLKELAIEVIDAAYLPENAAPFWPRTRDHDVLGLFLGLVSGLAAAFLIEYFSDTLKSEREAEEELNLPTLASIPDFTFQKPRS